MKNSDEIFQKQIIALYVCDDSRSVMPVPHILKYLGWNTFEAVYQEDFLRKAEVLSPDVIILDDLCIVEDLEFCRQLKASEQTKSMTVVVITARNAQVTQDKATEAGADIYFTAPIDVEELISILKNLF